ncbi:MAG: AsmA-like C-terminal region-containing protein [Crocinitomicaceae bacterium]|nr:AsmA-like C-terminal region-containing protein [Crocinitomicaceae bacterium]
MSKRRVFRILKWFFGIVFGLVLLITALLYIYKDDICNLVINEMNKHLSSKVEVAEVDLSFWGSFPNLSVDFNEVFIQDTYAGSTEMDTLLYSDRIRFKLNPMDIWSENYIVKSIEVSPGVLKLKVNDAGFNNFDVLKEKSDSLESEGFDLKMEMVEFEDFRFSYINHSTDQEYRTQINEMVIEGAFHESSFVATATSDLQIISARSGNINMVSNQPATLDIGIEVDKIIDLILIPSSTIYIANLPFDFNGEVRDSSFFFHLAGQDISIEDAANNLAMKEADNVKKFSGSGEFLFDLTINGSEDTIQPVSVLCEFGVDNVSLQEPNTGITLKKVSLDGMYTNEGGPSKERLELNDISFTTTGGPFRGNLLLTQFANPLFTGDADGSLNLAVVHSLFNIPNVQALNGTIDVHSDFKVQGVEGEDGRLSYHIEKCEGTMQMNQARFQLVDDMRVFDNINGLVYLRSNEAGIKDVSLKIGESDFLVNGVFKNVVDYFSGHGNLSANVSVTSNKIKLENLGTDTKEEKIQRERAYILPNNIDGTVYLDVKTLSYDKHTYEALKGNMSISGRTLHFPRVSLSNGGADVHGSITIEERSPELFHISSQLVSKNIRFAEMFMEWNNFTQDVITSNNISGVAQANLTFEAPFDLRTGIIANAIEAKLALQIDNGRLKDVSMFNTIVESLKTSGMKAFIGSDNITALGEELTDLKFDQLKNTLIIRNGIITLPSMTIKSSALDIEVSATHTFENQIDYKFAFYLRDLKQDEVSEFGMIVDDGLGLNIFMRMTGDFADPDIEWDKESSRQNRQEYNAQEKKDLKSMMKSEFGLFRNDTSVKAFVQTNVPTEELIIQFDPVNSIDTIIEVKTPEKDTKIRRKLRQWEEEDKDEEVEFEFDDD